MSFGGNIGLTLLCTLLAGCALPNGYYQPATIANGVISNPKVGWNGYSVKVPNGLDAFNPITANPDDPGLTQLQKWCIEDDERYSRYALTVYSERFLLEDPVGDGTIIFMSDTLELSSPWSAWLSPAKDYFLRKSINDKLVRINDTKAHNELVTINGQRGWYISGTDRPYFNKKRLTYTYEGYLILGNLKEMFWIEGWAPPGQRENLKTKTRAMADSLKIK